MGLWEHGRAAVCVHMYGSRVCRGRLRQRLGNQGQASEPSTRAGQQTEAKFVSRLIQLGVRGVHVLWGQEVDG